MDEATGEELRGLGEEVEARQAAESRAEAEAEARRAAEAEKEELTAELERLRTRVRDQ